MNFEDQLRSALGREPAPANFKRTLMARIEAESQRGPVSISWWQRRRISLALAAALVAGVAIPAGVVEHRREEQRRGMEARNQLITALSVTNTTLRHTKKMIRQTTRRAS